MLWKGLIVLGGIAALAYGAVTVSPTSATTGASEASPVKYDEVCDTAKKCDSTANLHCTGDTKKCACFDNTDNFGADVKKQFPGSKYTWDDTDKKCVGTEGAICNKDILCGTKTKDTKTKMQCVANSTATDAPAKCSGSRFDSLSALFITAIFGMAKVFV